MGLKLFIYMELFSVYYFFCLIKHLFTGLITGNKYNLKKKNALVYSVTIILCHKTMYTAPYLKGLSICKL